MGQGNLDRGFQQEFLDVPSGLITDLSGKIFKDLSRREFSEPLRAEKVRGGTLVQMQLIYIDPNYPPPQNWHTD